MSLRDFLRRKKPASPKRYPLRECVDVRDPGVKLLGVPIYLEDGHGEEAERAVIALLWSHFGWELDRKPTDLFDAFFREADR